MTVWMVACDSGSPASIRYCSARGIDPSSVDDKIFDEYWRYRTETTALPIAQYGPTLHGAGVERLRGGGGWLSARAAH